MSRLCYETSVCLSVTLVDCDRTVHATQWKSAHDRTGLSRPCLGYMHAEADLDRSILQS